MKLKGEIVSKDNENKKSLDKIDSLNVQISSLGVQIETLEQEKKVLEQKFSDADGYSEKAELELMEIKPKITEYERQIGVLNETISKKDKKIKELESTPKEVVQVADNEKELELKQEIIKAKGIIQNKNEEIDEMNELLDEIQSDVFMTVANSALPKVACNIELEVPDHGLKNVRLCVSGSGESGLTAYKVLHDEVKNNPKKKYLFIDLVNESYVDFVFGAKQIPNPLAWIEGRDSIKSYTANSNEKNVKVVSFGLNYMNDSYYLRVDWKSRLEELDRLGITVILYMGCIDCLVRNILFNSISKCCKTYVITKASPTNIRATLLHLNGFKTVEHTTVLCSEYAKSSEKMFNKLKGYYTCLIVDSTKSIGI
jgi:hypothetical protein